MQNEITEHDQFINFLLIFWEHMFILTVYNSVALILILTTTHNVYRSLL